MLLETLFHVALGIKIGSKQLSNCPENCLEEVLFPLPALVRFAYLSASSTALCNLAETVPQTPSFLICLCPKVIQITQDVPLSP